MHNRVSFLWTKKVINPQRKEIHPPIPLLVFLFASSSIVFRAEAWGCNQEDVVMHELCYCMLLTLPCSLELLGFEK
jgi:hypothetical protein